MLFCFSVDIIRDIKDPEHPHTLEELNVIRESDITLIHPPPTPNEARPSPNSQSSSDTSSREPSATDRGSSHDPQLSASAGVTAESTNFDDDGELWIRVQFTPTVPHCSLATLIGLCLRMKLERTLDRRFKLDIFVNEGTHSIEGDVNKQINDKERVAAAMENSNLRELVEECIREAEY